MIRISDIKIPAAPPEKEKGALEAKLRKIAGNALPPYHIVRHSLDARKKPQIFSVYTVDLAAGSEEKKLLKRLSPYKGALVKEKQYELPAFTGEGSPRVLIAGAGPAGLFAALALAKAGLKPLLIEQGAPVQERREDVEAFWQGGALKPWSNVQFGEGGAGTFSDGKLMSGIRDREGRIAYMLDCFVKAGAPEEIRWEAKPHIGTDGLRRVVKGLREQILQAGGQIRFHTRMTDILTDNNRISAVVCQNTKTGEQEKLAADVLVLALGHSARESFRMLHAKGVVMEPKPFALGLRIQHPQEQIDRCQYGSGAPGYLPAADYKLTAKASDGRGVYSFCMCPGGYVVNASSEPGRLCVNGMSDSARDGAGANAALVVQIRPEDTAAEGLFGGMRLQERWEEAAFKAGGGRIPLQLWADFAEGKISERLGSVLPACKGLWAFADLRKALPDFAVRALLEAMPQFEDKLPGFGRGDALLFGVESRTSSPLRLLRNEEGESNIEGLYPCGEGAGYAGGITSAAVDGLKEAEKVIRALNRRLQEKGE